MTQPRRFTFAGLLVATGAVTASLSLAGFAGRLWWPLELLTHFRAQYFVSLLVLAIAAAALGRRRAGALLSAVALVNAITLVPLFLGGAPARPDARTPARRAVLFNVYVFNTEHARVLTWLRDVDADVIALQETDREWQAAMQPLRATHPHVLSRIRSDPFGITVFSRFPLGDARIEMLGEASVPSAIARVALPEGPCTVFSTHPVPPWGGALMKLRDEHMARVSEFLREAERPLLLLGDLNLSPTSPIYTDALAACGLSDSAAGFGYQPSWPSATRWIGIPLDHCWHSPEIEILDRRIGPDLGSDHRPLIVDFRLSLPR